MKSVFAHKPPPPTGNNTFALFARWYDISNQDGVWLVRVLGLSAAHALQTVRPCFRSDAQLIATRCADA